MQAKRIQNKVAESRFSLPLTALYTIAVCFANGLVEQQLWVQFGCIIVSTLLLVEFNNYNALIRIYSRMVSCSFLVIIAAATFLFPSLHGSIVMLCYAAFCVVFYRAYQNKRAADIIYYAFILIGIASIPFVQVLFFVPVLWLLMLANVFAMSGRTFCASLLGLMTPYWFLGVYYIFQGDLHPLMDHFTSIATFSELFNYDNVNLHEVVMLAYVSLLALIGSVHFLRNSYKDKIRTRMLYESFITVDVCCIIFLVLQPQHFDCVMRIMIINTAPLIGHFIALTRTRFTNIVFLFLILLSLSVTAFNLWMPSLTF